MSTLHFRVDSSSPLPDDRSPGSYYANNTTTERLVFPTNDIDNINNNHDFDDYDDDDDDIEDFVVSRSTNEGAPPPSYHSVVCMSILSFYSFFSYVSVTSHLATTIN